MNEFDVSKRDSQATAVKPVAPEALDYPAYANYAAAKREGIQRFLDAESGILVYRRMRAGACFSGQCRDMEYSLAMQLGTLQKSMAYEADIPNFLEPWYGIGTAAAAFDIDYVWEEAGTVTLPIGVTEIKVFPVGKRHPTVDVILLTPVTEPSNETSGKERV